jgi:hypothetical protein
MESFWKVIRIGKARAECGRSVARSGQTLAIRQSVLIDKDGQFSRLGEPRGERDAWMPPSLLNVSCVARLFCDSATNEAKSDVMQVPGGYKVRTPSMRQAASDRSQFQTFGP